MGGSSRYDFPTGELTTVMEPKRELSSVDIAAVVAEIGEFTGAKVDKAYLYDDDLVRLRLRHFDRGRVEVLIQVSGVKRVHVSDPANVPDAPSRPPSFAKMLRNRIGSADFSGIEQHGFDRVVEFHFERPDGRTTLIAELFGDGNIAVLDETGAVIDCLQPVRVTSRTVVPGSQYEFPASRVNPFSIPYDAFVAQMETSDTDVVRTLATQLNLGGLYAEEVCARSRVEKETPIDGVSEAEFDRLFDAIGSLRTSIQTGTFDPRIYYADGRAVDVAPVALLTYDHLETDVFDSFNEALDEYFVSLRQETPTDSAPGMTEQIEKQERIIEQQQTAIDRFEDEAQQYREDAEALYANYAIVDEVLQTIREARADGVSWDAIESRLNEGAERGIQAAEIVAGIDEANGHLSLEIDGRTIHVDPSVGVEKNADRLYQEAKQTEEKRAGAIDALEDTRDRLATLRERRDADESDEVSVSESVDNWLVRNNIPVRKPDHWYERFRWFRSSDGFLVIGGRNADQNEELVKKYLDPFDRFFHAQAHGAPVTIVKATAPNERARDVDIPTETLNEAARFAVTYSSVWKNGQFAGDAYCVGHDQVSKTPESGEHVSKGSFVIRGDRTYYRDVPVDCTVGIQCSPETRILGGPSRAITHYAETTVAVEPGGIARSDVAKRIYREFRDRFADTAFVRSIASPDEIARFLPPGTSRIVTE